MQPAERDARIGSVVEGRYRILDCMAAGSMGVVYRAERVPVGKTVAIKFLHAAFAADQEFLVRFERETRVMSKLAHPHCVSVLDFGVVDGAPYLVMDYVTGTTLREVLDDTGAMPVPRGLGLVRQILAGLAHAHDQGVVHRDIKPANLMISDEIGTGQHVRILDFGLARLRGALGANATQANVVVGTPSYMAPEQTVDAAVDARADLYAAGVVLFEVITGDKPFWSDSTLELLAMHRSAPIPQLARVAPTVEVPAGLQALIDRALAKDPGDRFQTAIEFAAALDDVIAGKAKPAKRGRAATPRPSSMGAIRLPTEMQPAKSRAWLFWVALLIGSALAAAWFLDGSDAPPAAARPGAAASPDGGALAAAKPPAADAGVVPALASDAAAGVIADAATLPDAMALADAEAIPNAAVVVVPVAAGDAGAGVVLPEDEVEPDPATADDPNPEAAVVATGSAADEEEAPDAPAGEVEIEIGPAPPPAREPLARTVNEAVRMIRAGKRELALASLRALRKKKPTSAYIPFLLGNLYFDKRWWSVALEHYGAAIFRNSAYKRNSTLNRNVIRMLASGKTRAKAERFVRRTVGRAAKPYLRYALKHDPNKTVRKRSAVLVRAIK